MSILLITSNEVFDITTKYFSRTLSVSVLKYRLKMQKRAPLLGLAKFIYQLSISVAFFHTQNSKRKISNDCIEGKTKHDCFWSFSKT